jgi:GntR family transcriptional repressor for pyruvate dehydrogenase complex
MDRTRGTDQTIAESTDHEFLVVPVMRPREQVESQLRAAILSGSFTRGQRLPSEAKLSEQFCVSRATIREALRTLAEAGLISKSPGANGGSFVIYFDHRMLGEVVSERLGNTLELGSISYDEVAEFRNMLEIPAARLAAMNHTPDHVAQLHDVIEREKMITVDDPMVDTYNSEFHRIIAEASGNRLVATFVAALHRVTHPLRFIDTSPEVGKQAVLHHIAIVSALADRDPDRTAERMQRHLDYLREHAAPAALKTGCEPGSI